MLLGLAGLAVIAASQGDGADGLNTAWGITQCLLSTICFAAYQLACDLYGGDALDFDAHAWWPVSHPRSLWPSTQT